MRSRTTAGRSPVVLALLAAVLRLGAPAAARGRRAGASRACARRGARPPGNASLRAGVVSVRVTGQDWNWRAPWEKQPPWTRTVTGLVVPGQRILVASTAFGNPLLVEAQKLGGDARTVARVELVDHEGPLALVAVDDPAFWEGLAPLPLEPRAWARAPCRSCAGSARACSTPTPGRCARCAPGATACRRRAC